MKEEMMEKGQKGEIFYQRTIQQCHAIDHDYNIYLKIVYLKVNI